LKERRLKKKTTSLRMKTQSPLSSLTKKLSTPPTLLSYLALNPTGGNSALLSEFTTLYNSALHLLRLMPSQIKPEKPDALKPPVH